MDGKTIALGALLAGIAPLTSCQTPLAASGGGTVGVGPNLVRTVEFDHHCNRDRIIVLAELPEYGLYAQRTATVGYDLNVCGAFRRYKYIGKAWLDVTALYPPTSLHTEPANTPRPSSNENAPAE